MLTLAALFKNVYFRIPDYQRGYAWKSDKQLQELWDDIDEIMEKIPRKTGKQQRKDRFLKIICKEEKMEYWIEPVTRDFMPDGSIRYYSHGHDITDGYEEKQDRIREMLGTSYHTLMDTLKKRIKGFDQDCSNWGEEQNIQLEIQGNEVLALFDLWEYAAEEYPNCRVGDMIGEWTCREIIEKNGGYGKTYLVLFSRPLTRAIQR